jgi:DNA-binding NarL/FixJ family response regulator
MVINDVKPRLVLVGSSFYQAGTPFMMGQLLKRFPGLNIAAVSMHEYPAGIAAWFIFHGIKSYLDLWEGYEAFHRGLQVVREGREYISPGVKEAINAFDEWPKTGNKMTARLIEVLVLLCNGFTAESIGKELHLSRKTVYNDMNRLYGVLNAQCRDEVVAKGWAYRLVSEKDMGFLDRRKETVLLPEWAEAKRRMGKKQKK